MVKVISLSNEAYEKLKAIKGNRSFSEIVVEITEVKKKKNILEFAGAFADNADEWKRIGNVLDEARRKEKLREVKF